MRFNWLVCFRPVQCGYSKDFQENRRKGWRSERARESEREYSVLLEVGFCRRSHLDWETAFPTEQEWRQTDMATDDKEEQHERTVD